MICKIPDIIFNDHLLPLPELAPTRINSMATLLRNLGIIDIRPFQNVIEIVEFEKHIHDLIRQCRTLGYPENMLYEIFHRIQIWGGITGRNIYNRDGGVYNNLSIQDYKNLAISCANPFNICKVYQAVVQMKESSRHLGISFITKHTRFWLVDTDFTWGELPVFDSVMSQNLCNVKYPKIENLLPYWCAMISTSETHKKDLKIIERDLFRLFQGA